MVFVAITFSFYDFFNVNLFLYRFLNNLYLNGFVFLVVCGGAILLNGASLLLFLFLRPFANF